MSEHGNAATVESAVEAGKRDEPTVETENRDETAVDTSHLDGVEDGCGCAEVWEHLSDERGE